MNFVMVSALLATIFNTLLVSVIIAIAIEDQTKRNPTVFSLALYILSLGLWSLCVFGLGIPQNVETAFIWVRVLNLAIISIPILFIQVVIMTVGVTKFDHFYLGAAYAVSAIFLLLSPTAYFTKDLRLFDFGYFSIPGPVFPIWLAFFVILVIGGHIRLIMAYRATHTTTHKKNQIKYILLASFVATLGGISSFPNFIGIKTYPLWTITNAFYALILAYAILKYRLMDLSLAIKKTTAYSLVTTGITFIYLAIILSFELLFREIFNGHYSITTALPAALIIALTFIPLRDYLQNITDQLFFRRTIEYRKVLREVTHALSSVTDLKVLFRLIDQTVIKVMCIKTAAVLLLEDKQDHYLLEKTNGLPKSLDGLALPGTNPLVAYLIETKEQVTIDDIRENFNATQNKEEMEKYAAIAAEMERLSAALAVPSFVKNKLVGILTLGEKLSGEPYTAEDIELIATMASEAGIAIENAKLYRDVIETKDYLNSIIQNTDDAVITLDLDGRVLSWNAGAEKIFGLTPKETLNGYPSFLTEGETRDFVGRILNGETVRAMEIYKKVKNIENYPLLLTCSPIKGGEQIIGLSLILKDISELKKVDETKKEFLSTVSHELRTPLTPIKGYVSLLLQGNIGSLDPKQKEVLETVLKNTNHLHDLIESIIDISRIEAGKPLEIEKEPFFLEKTIKESVDNSAASFSAKGIAFAFNYSDGDLAILGDRKKIIRVMDNLLGNALKFTPKGGEVAVSLQRQDKLVKISISDTGIGLEKSHYYKIFERFYQVDSSYTRATGGIGMGLAIAKEIIEAHNGRIWAESDGIGHGSRFTFTLPLI
ncbi:MAG: ATP-binding protein [Candidatus Margulisiibacteriota bacterium]|jgi:PAS domain S-box-containing protein